MTDPYASGVLHKERDERLVAGLAKFSRDAGIQPYWVWTPIAELCGDAEREYLTAFRRQKNGALRGLAYVGEENGAVLMEDRMSAIAGLLTRNYVRARLITVGVLLERIAAGDTPDHDCLLIPNFYMRKTDGGGIAPWQVAALCDLLLQRAASGQQTVVFVGSMTGLEAQYGPSCAALIKTRFLQTNV